MSFEPIDNSEFLQGKVNDAYTVRALATHFMMLPMEERPAEMQLGGGYQNVIRILFKKIESVVSESVELALKYINVGETVVNLEEHYLQENTPHPAKPDDPVQTCVLATIRNVLKTLGKDVSQIPTESVLISQINVDDVNQYGLSMRPSNRNEITIADNYLVKLLSKEGVDVEPTRNLIDIIDAVQKGLPVVIAQHVLGGNQHSVLISGYRYSQDCGFEFQIADPLEKESSFAPIEDVAYAALDVRFYTSYICKIRI